VLDEVAAQKLKIAVKARILAEIPRFSWSDLPLRHPAASPLLTIIVLSESVNSGWM
jgi:hypothetical protein